MKGKFRCVCRNYCRCEYAVAFGLGLVVSCFCPNGLLLFMSAVIMVALGIAVARRSAGNV